MQSSNYWAYLNTLAERGLTTPTVSKVWCLVELHHTVGEAGDTLRIEFLTAAESRTALLWAQLVTVTPRLALGCPVSFKLCCSRCLATHPGRPWEYHLKFEPRLSREHRGPPQGRPGAELQAQKSQHYRDLHRSTISTTCKHSDTHTQIRTAKSSTRAKLKFSEWDACERSNAAVSST